MKNIEPFNPNVKPEEKPAVPVPEKPAQEQPPVTTPPPASAPANPEPEKPKDNAFGSANLPLRPTESSQSIYPTPLSIEERRANQQQVSQERAQASGFSLSQVIIPAIVGLYAIYSIFEIIRSISLTGASFGLLYAFGPGGALSKYIWMFIIFGLVLLIMAVIVSYKILRGSKIALALLTGPLVVYLMYMSVVYLGALLSFGQTFGSFTAVLQFLAEIVLAIMLVMAWTTDKKYYR